jgi:hypothetical protein
MRVKYALNQICQLKIANQFFKFLSNRAYSLSHFLTLRTTNFPKKSGYIYKTYHILFKDNFSNQ